MRQVTAEVVCPLCERVSRIRSCFENDEHGLKRCIVCGVVFVYPRIADEELLAQYTEEYFERKYSEKLDTGYTDSGTWDRKMSRCLQDAAELCASKVSNVRLLDVGCGIGRFLFLAQHAGFEVEGLELASSVAQQTSKRLGVPIIEGSIFCARIPERSFDVITMFDVIEHLEEPIRALEICWKSLKPGGVLALTTPNFSGLGRRALGAHAFAIWPSEHIIYFEPGTMRIALRRAGFSTVRISSREIYPENIDKIVRRITGASHTTQPNDGIWRIKRVARSSHAVKAVRAIANLVFAKIPVGDEMLVFARKTPPCEKMENRT